jgi:hypothetical protein
MLMHSTLMIYHCSSNRYRSVHTCYYCVQNLWLKLNISLSMLLLFHIETGRASHSSYQKDGAAPIGPSAIAIQGDGVHAKV